jgi:hypothetical protein
VPLAVKSDTTHPHESHQHGVNHFSHTTSELSPGSIMRQQVSTVCDVDERAAQQSNRPDRKGQPSSVGRAVPFLFAAPNLLRSGFNHLRFCESG